MGRQNGKTNVKESMKKDQEEETKEGGETNELTKIINEAVLSQKPNVSWDDVAGLETAKNALQ